jgi:hypothetical protein
MIFKKIVLWTILVIILCFSSIICIAATTTASTFNTDQLKSADYSNPDNQKQAESYINEKDNLEAGDEEIVSKYMKAKYGVDFSISGFSGQLKLGDDFIKSIGSLASQINPLTLPNTISSIKLNSDGSFTFKPMMDDNTKISGVIDHDKSGGMTVTGGSFIGSDGKKITLNGENVRIIKGNDGQTILSGKFISIAGITFDKATYINLKYDDKTTTLVAKNAKITQISHPEIDYISGSYEIDKKHLNGLKGIKVPKSSPLTLSVSEPSYFHGNYKIYSGESDITLDYSTSPYDGKPIKEEGTFVRFYENQPGKDIAIRINSNGQKVSVEVDPFDFNFPSRGYFKEEDVLNINQKKFMKFFSGIDSDKYKDHIEKIMEFQKNVKGIKVDGLFGKNTLEQYFGSKDPQDLTLAFTITEKGSTAVLDNGYVDTTGKVFITQNEKSYITDGKTLKKNQNAMLGGVHSVSIFDEQGHEKKYAFKDGIEEDELQKILEKMEVEFGIDEAILTGGERSFISETTKPRKDFTMQECRENHKKYSQIHSISDALEAGNEDMQYGRNDLVLVVVADYSGTPQTYLVDPENGKIIDQYQTGISRFGYGVEEGSKRTPLGPHGLKALEPGESTLSGKVGSLTGPQGDSRFIRLHTTESPGTMSRGGARQSSGCIVYKKEDMPEIYNLILNGRDGKRATSMIIIPKTSQSDTMLAEWNQKKQSGYA